MELFDKTEYNLIFTKKELGAAKELASIGPYRYLMDLNNETLKNDQILWFPNKHWINDNWAGYKPALVMHGIMHNLGFNHYQTTSDFGTNITAETAITQYIASELPKLINKQGDYADDATQKIYNDLLTHYKAKYGGL